MHTPTVSTFDVAAKRRTRVSSTKDEAYSLESCEIRRNALYFRTGDIGDPFCRSIEGFVLPELNIQIVRFSWREDKERDFDFYIDIVRVNETGERWVVTDLYLDILVYEGHKLTIVDTDEYLAAIAEGKLTPADAEHTLEVTHQTANDLAQSGYRLYAYLERKGITLQWD